MSKPNKHETKRGTKRESKRCDEAQCLPILQHKATLTKLVKDNVFLVVTGETGSGKTTQLPQYLYEAGTRDRFRSVSNTIW